DHFMARYAAKNGKQIGGLTRAALSALEAYPWPGNVRELEHAIERAVVLSRGAQIDVDDLPESVRSGGAGRAAGIGAALEGRTLAVPLGTTMEEIELRVIRETLRQTKGDKNLAAPRRGVDRPLPRGAHGEHHRRSCHRPEAGPGAAGRRNAAGRGAAPARRARCGKGGEAVRRPPSEAGCSGHRDSATAARGMESGPV